MSAMTSVADLLARGRQALSSAAWPEARDAFEEILATEEAAEALEGLAWAHWWLDDGAASLAARERAFAAYRSGGDDRGAARTAIWLAEDYRSFRGDLAIANGWHQRARSLLRELAPAPEHGWLALHEGSWLLDQQDDPDAARARAAEAIAAGRRFGDIDLEMLGMTIEGVALVVSGRVEEGMRRLDEAATAGLAGETRELFAVAWAACALIGACEQARDFNRAAEWCERLSEVAERLQTRFWMGVCRVQYGSVLIWRGEWAEAETELAVATERLESSRPPMVAEGIVRLAELRRRQGLVADATELFDRVGPHPLAMLGRAEIALEHGDARDADGLLEQIRRNLPQTSRTRRAPVLELLVRTKAALGELDAADAALEELRSAASLIGTEPVRAGLDFAEGVLSLARGDHEPARTALEDATARFEKAGAPFEAARARLELAKALAGLGRGSAARREAGQARAAFERIGAADHERRAHVFAASLDVTPAAAAASAPPGDGAGLTPREIEVLRLIAKGLSDRQMATRLGLSEHTIHRHVSKILTKLVVPSRAAAVALAGERGLL